MLSIDIACRIALKFSNLLTDADLKEMWDELKVIDPSVSRDDTALAKLKDKKALMHFLKSHCLEHHYMFSVNKCLVVDCAVCSIS